MTAQKIPQQQVDGLDTLKQLIDLAKNPQVIVDAQETARKQMRLTEDEELKVKQARDFMATYDQAVADLKKRKSDAEEVERRVVEKSEQHNQSVADQSAALEARKIELDNKETALANERKKHEENIRKLESDRIAGDARAKINDEAMKQREDRCKRCEEANAAERERMARTRDLLDKRTKAIAEAANVEE